MFNKLQYSTITVLISCSRHSVKVVDFLAYNMPSIQPFSVNYCYGWWISWPQLLVLFNNYCCANTSDFCKHCHKRSPNPGGQQSCWTLESQITVSRSYNCIFLMGQELEIRKFKLLVMYQHYWSAYLVLSYFRHLGLICKLERAQDNA